MALGPEHKLQARVVKFLKEFKNGGDHDSDKLYWRKIADNFNSGLPDLEFVMHGHHAAYELKAPGKEPTKLQLLVMSEIEAAGGIVGWGDDIDAFEAWFIDAWSWTSGCDTK